MAELETERLEASLLADSPEPQRPIFDIAKFKTGGGTDFREANGYSWDFVMVMPCSKPQDAERSAKFINKIRQAVRWRAKGSGSEGVDMLCVFVCVCIGIGFVLCAWNALRACGG